MFEKRLKRRAEEPLQKKMDELDQFFNVTLDLLCVANRLKALSEECRSIREALEARRGVAK